MSKFNLPTEKQFIDLVGGKPLAFSFNCQTGDLVVISPTGQKFHFTPNDWEEAPDQAPSPKKTSKTKK
jgi:hypothetical protein